MMMISPWILLLTIFTVGVVVDVDGQRQCRCYATGATMPQLLNWMSAGQQPYNCQPTGQCTANPNTGCFRAFQNNMVAVFCGQDELATATQGANRPKSDQISALITKGYVQSQMPNNGNCTPANLNTYGLCYCDSSDFCNSIGNASHLKYLLLPTVAMLVLLAVFN